MTPDFPHAARSSIKNEALKRKLIESVSEQKDKFLAVAEVFNALQRREEQDYLTLCNAIIDAVDQVLATGDWEDSQFIRNTIKPLKEIRDQALELRESFSDAGTYKKVAAPEVAENSVKLYVLLYQSVGHDMKKWVDQLSSLGSHMIGRPVYQREEDAVSVIRTKLSQTSEAYVVVAVDQSKIISQEYGKPRKDKLGNELISLLPGAVSAENILEFIHQGKRYHFSDHQLVLMEGEDKRNQADGVS